MEQNVLNHNRSFTLGKSLLVSCAFSIATLAGLVGAYDLITKPPAIAPAFTSSKNKSVYGLLAVKITSENTGEAVINLDGFRVYTSFDFEKFIDSNGTSGSEYTGIEITNLAVDQVFDANGNNYNDFTNSDDIRNIISVIKAHVQKNKMVGA
ncbi:hypothetical protein [Acinetobacter baumannii]|uniref:hypothetical protein n=1 Tax=Acinetobacter baumannii TaxID=470 RepID=UPI001F4F951D|nr:hypothetical protein [Acinetobacter baumannii]USX62828.1 hypothetical protein NHY65_08960 [Acinetobacter baumannii]WOQ34677.1 hypothetical protein R3L13_05715 [Acinetobacter baumannii]